MSTRRAFMQQVAVASVAPGFEARSAPTIRDNVKERSHSSLTTCKIPHTNLVVSRIAYGSASLVGSAATASADDLSKATQAVHTAFDCGITLFDTADVYGFGNSEKVLGQVFAQSPGLRNKIVIQSKCGQVFPEGWKPGDPVIVDLSREHIVNSVEASLRRLSTDRLDILLLHAPDALMNPEDVGHAFDALSRAGKVRYFGVSNHNAAQITLLRKCVHQPLVVNQISLGLAYPYPLVDGMEFTLQLLKSLDANHAYKAVAGAGTIDYCRANDIQIQAWSPLRGVLNPPPSASTALAQTALLIAKIASDKGVSPSAIALAWLLRHPAGIVPITGTLEPRHIEENCTADRVTLSREEWYALLATATDLSPLYI